MGQLTGEERAEWIAEADDALRCHMVLRGCDAKHAFAELATTHVWREAQAQWILRAAFTAMTAPTA